MSKGGDVEYVMWSSGTAHLLPRLIRGRTRGPVFLCRRRPVLARRPPARDICPDTGRARLDYDRARVLLDRYTSSGKGQPGWELHQLRSHPPRRPGRRAATHHRQDPPSQRPHRDGYVKPSAAAVAEVTELLDIAPPRR